MIFFWLYRLHKSLSERKEVKGLLLDLIDCKFDKVFICENLTYYTCVYYSCTLILQRKGFLYICRLDSRLSRDCVVKLISIVHEYTGGLKACMRDEGTLIFIIVPPVFITALLSFRLCTSYVFPVDGRHWC
jgi:hypothetical protein